MSDTKRATVKDIANELHISIGTVSKALTGKRGISDEMRESIEEAAKRLGYSVNRQAQCLARKPIRIGVVYPAAWEEFYGPLIGGMKEAMESLRDYNVFGEFVHFSGLYSTDELSAIMDRMIEEKIDAVILCPASVTAGGSILSKLKIHGIPVFLVGNDFQKEDRVACVQVDAVMAGRLAGEIMGYLTPPDASLTAFIGDKGMMEHLDKVKGFEQEIGGQRKLVSTFETRDDPEIAAYLARKAIQEIPDIAGMYIATGNSLAICNVLTELGLNGRIKVIATDLFDDMKPFIEDRTINAVIYQYPARLGNAAVTSCYKYLTERKIPNNTILIEPSPIFRSQLSKNSLLQK